MDKGIPMTPDILELLGKSDPDTEAAKKIQQQTIRRNNESAQFLMLLVIVAAFLVSALPILLHQTNTMIGDPESKELIPPIYPSPTPDSSLLFFINKDK